MIILFVHTVILFHLIPYDHYLMSLHTNTVSYELATLEKGYEMIKRALSSNGILTRGMKSYQESEDCKN